MARVVFQRPGVLAGHYTHFADSRAQLLAHREAAKKRRRLPEFFHHRVDGAFAVAVHDAVERLQKMLLDRLPRRLADELLSDGANARREIDQLAVFLIGTAFRFFFWRD